MARRIAIAGVGKIARDQHLPAIAAASDWELGAVADPRGGVDAVPAYASLGDLLNRHPDITCVSVCTPPQVRYQTAMQAIEAGRHVLLEKPPGASVSECLALEAAARAKGVTIHATWHSREAAQVAPAKAWLVGRTVRRLTVEWREDVRRWHPGQDWIFEAGGLGVFDPGINALSIVTEILPDPIHVTGSTLYFPENREAPIRADIAFHHPGGAEVTAVFDFLKQGPQLWTIEVETTDGSLVLSDGGAALAIDGRTQAVPEVGLDAADDGSNPMLGGEYNRLYARFARLVETGGVDMDLSPMIHTADSFLLGRRETAARFDW